MKILIAEDELYIREGLRDLLEGEGYATVCAEEGNKALTLFESEEPDLVLLDIMIPGKDGYSLCREIRNRNQDVPVIFISAKSEEIDRVVGLELGADDYIMKPFGTREVVARIRAVTRRYLKSKASSPAEPENKLEFGDLVLFPDELRARRGETSMDLSLRDVRILQLLHTNAGKIVERDSLFNHCWGQDYLPSSRTLDQHISKLRKRIEKNPQQPEIIKTVHGVGYRYEILEG
ncbi:MAG: response regulator transcription factor [Candidatus Nitronauta litoralis]|uniref:Response regulator transcription factor n=1 Tax=Candidatus Nitronauta litoralis TaxID=2705533 RepID=A0A7T0BWA3_9BACT|nr:MAG: response regulator transcription factor [Candidatus Nitronauta litoralis]